MKKILTIHAFFFQDLLGVSMILPLLPKLTYNLGASRSVSGLIGIPVCFSVSLSLSISLSLSHNIRKNACGGGNKNMAHSIKFSQGYIIIQGSIWEFCGRS